MALATNTQLPAAGKTSRQPASAQKRKLALELARAKFSEKGLPEQMLSRIEIEPWRAPSSHDKNNAAIGAFTLPLPGHSGILHSVLFIASDTDGHLTPEFTWTKISESEAGSEVLRFVDQADLFGDGQQEVRRGFSRTRRQSVPNLSTDKGRQSLGASLRDRIEWMRLISMQLRDARH
jgi:hypothetical protein